MIKIKTIEFLNNLRSMHIPNTDILPYIRELNEIVHLLNLVETFRNSNYGHCAVCNIPYHRSHALTCSFIEIDKQMNRILEKIEINNLQEIIE